MSLRKTAKFSLYYFEDGDVFSAKADMTRFKTVENQLDLALSLTQGGILNGWAIVQTSEQTNTNNITIQAGFGIVPFTIDKLDNATGKVVKEQHFLGVRTNAPIVIPSIGLNKINVVYIELNRQILNLIQNNDNAIVDITEETVNIVVRPSSSDSSGSGPFRTTSATDDAGNLVNPTTGFTYDEYPIYFRKIDGAPFESDNNKIVIYVNDNLFSGGYFISGSQGNVIGFNNPLHPEDNVTVRLDPAYSLVLGEVLTDNSKVIDINNDVKEYAKEKSTNFILSEKILTHAHNNLEDNPDKILLTTKTANIASTSSTNNSIYIFNKPNISEYGFDFAEETYSIEVYVNDFISTQQAKISATATNITATFSSNLEASDIVTIVLILNEDQTNIVNKLKLSSNNPSAQKIDIKISAEKISSGTLDPLKIPKLSHIGRNLEILRPANDPVSSREYVHRTEYFDFEENEFFPVHKNKTNARNAKYLFFDQKTTAGKLIHACASDGFMYMLSDNIMFEDPEKFIGGWTSIIVNDPSSNEYDAPFKIIPIKDPINTTSNNWDRIFYIGNRFITQNTWNTTSNPKLDEVVNLSSDRNSTFHNTTLTSLNGIEIFDACGGKSPMNMQKTAFLLIDNKVWFYDYSSTISQYFWFDITSDPPWSGIAKSLSSVEISGETILFVGTDSGEVWCNILSSANLINILKSGSNFISQGNISFKPKSIWEKNTYSYGQGLGIVPSYFDVFNIRGNNFGYGNVGYDYGFEEKLPIKSGDNLLFVTVNSTERKKVISALDNSITLETGVKGTYSGSTNLANSIMILDWFKIDDGLTGTVKKVDFDGDKLVVMTNSNFYYSLSIDFPSDLFLNESFTFFDASAISGSFNDFGFIDDDIIVASDLGLFKAIWNGVSYSWSVLENVDVVTSINNILFPSYSIKIDNGDIYSCGKYGIFKSVDSGVSWRNTIQILGLPEDRLSPFTLEKEILDVVLTDADKNRIYFIESKFPYGYGFGYGYGEGIDYFDVFSFSSSTYGYGFGSFESDYSGNYGYGYGFELQDAIKSINNNDWIYFSKNSGSIYENTPIKIINKGIEPSNNLFFVEVELSNAEKIDFNNIIENQKFGIFRKKEALALIDGIPQDVRYKSNDIIPYEVDYDRQSVIFSESLDFDKTITIASEYKAFEPIELSILNLTVDEIKINGLTKTYNTRDIKNDNFISLSFSLNIDDIVKLIIKGVYIQDVGILSHEELEDSFSIEELGLPYKFEGIRTSNFLGSLMALQHAFPKINNSETLSEIKSTISAVGVDYISDSSKNYMPNSLIGRKIILDSDNKKLDYTIKSNTESNIYILPKKTYFEFLNVDGVETTFEFGKNAKNGSIDVYVDNELQILSVDYEYNTISGEIVSISFFIAPIANSRILIGYVSTDDYIDVSNVTSIGDSYIIIGENLLLFKDLINTFVSMHDSSDVDVESSFIENNIVSKNDVLGIITQAVSYVYFNPLDNNIYAGTNKGIWKRNENVSIYKKTSELINTIDSTGPIDLPDSIHGFYVQYDKITKEWTATWGLGIDNKDINYNIDSINITAIANNPIDSTMILAGSENALYRTVDSGETWNVVWNFAQDDRIASNPIPRSIVFDDKNPWIVNVVNQTGLFRSFDYGNSFEKIASYDIDNKGIDASKSFAYQIDSTDTRGVFYYGENSLQIKKSKDSSSFGEQFPSLVKTESSDIIGISLGDLSINRIINYTNDVNTLFISSESYGMMKSTVCGNDCQISTDKFQDYYVNFTNELIDEFNNPDNLNFTNNTGAFYFVHDPDVAGQIAGRYRIFVDKLKNRTYVLTKIEQDKKIPKHGEFVGKFITLEVENLKTKIYKIIEHYDRGLLPSGSSIIDHRGNKIPSHIIEFVLEGTYPFLYNQADLPRPISDYNYYWYGDSNFSTAGSKNPQILQSGFKIPLFRQNNGSIFNPIINGGNLFEINGTGLTCLASLSDGSNLFSSIGEHIISIFYPIGGDVPASEFEADNGLKDYIIGDIQSETKYSIVESKSKVLIGDETTAYHAIILLRILPFGYDDFNLNGFDDPINIWNFSASNTPPTPVGINAQLAIYSNCEIVSKTANSIVIKNGNLPSLVGYVVYPISDNNIYFKIASNTDNEIFTNSTIIDSITSVGDFVRIGGKIQSSSVKDFTIDQTENIIVVAAKDNPYMSFDSGETWRLINSGLPINSNSLESLVKFEKIIFKGSFVYACALNYAPNVGGGIYKSDGTTWSSLNGSGLNYNSVNDFCVLDSGVIYAGTVNDGVYKGVNSGSGYVWSKMIFPEHKVTAIKTTIKDNENLETIFIGTDGKGLFQKNGTSSLLWNSNYSNILKNTEIKSKIWRAWDIYEASGNIFVESMFSNIEKISTSYGFYEIANYFTTKYSPILEDNIVDSSNFDWSAGNKSEDTKNIPQILSLDQSNSTYITENINRTITDVDGPEYKRLSKFISGINGAGRKSEPSGTGFDLRGIGKSSSPLGIEKVNISNNQTTIYEEPFSHLPDRQSITAIKEFSSGRVFFGTDRSGIWRSKSNDGKSYLLPFNDSPSSTFDDITYGYDFDSTKLGRFKATSLSDFTDSIYGAGVLSVDPTGDIGFVSNATLFDGVSNSASFYKAEKIFTYSAEAPSDIFNDINAIDFNTLIGGYLVIAENITESGGVIGNRIAVEIINCVKESATQYKLFLSAGSIQNTLPVVEVSYGPWDDLEKEIATPTGNYTKVCIIDFESYEDISSNLPKNNVKNSIGSYESSVFIRDISCTISTIALACGIGGIFVSNTINEADIDDVSWFNLDLPQTGMDITSIIIEEALSIFDIYISTWGNGVWKYEGASWSGSSFNGGTWNQIDNSGLKHKNVWKIFKSSDSVLYAGTENGGIYSCDSTLTTPLWTREIDNITRSKLFMWKTEGVPSLKSGGLDYSTSDKLLCYSFGGGIMRSLDRGNTWGQAISGLENLYIQDVCICPNNENVVYAATVGGGIFKTTNAFSGNCNWNQISNKYFPDTLNVDQIEVGTNPDIIYAKFRLNDLSYKDLPESLKFLAELASSPSFNNGDWTGSLDSSYFNNSNFTPIQPYLKGARKAILLRSADGGESWTSVYDKDPNISSNYNFSSGIFGLSITPKHTDRVQFLYKSIFTSNDSSLTSVNKFLFVTIESGNIISENVLKFDSCDNFKLLNQKSEAYISINQNNIDNIYISLQGEVGNNEFVSRIYVSEDGGETWDYASGHFTSSASFNNKVQISTKAKTVEIGTTSYDSESFSIDGLTQDVGNNTAEFNEAKEFYLQNFNRTIVANFNEDSDPYFDSLFFTYRDEPVLSKTSSYPRPFYLNGAKLKININQPLVNIISDGGNGMFLPKITKNLKVANSPQLATFVLSETYKANLINPVSNTCRIFNLTSIKFDYYSLAETSILRKENSLIGLSVTIASKKTSIAFHRAIYNSKDDVSPSKIELLIIGDYGALFPAGTSVSITLEPPIYSNYDNDFMMSVNKGMSWKKIGKESFSLASNTIKGVCNNTILPSSTPVTVRSTYIIRDENDFSVIYRGDAKDTRYSGGLYDSLEWTQIANPTYFAANKVLNNGMSFDVANNSLFISEVDRISTVNLNTLTITSLFDGLKIYYPVVASEADSSIMAFVANDSIYTTKDGFATFNISPLPSLISALSINKILLSKTSLFIDEIILCVNSAQSFDQALCSIKSVSSTITENLIILSLDSGQTNPFNNFKNRIITFDNINSNIPFSTKIINSSYDSIYTSNTLSSNIVLSEYNSITDMTLLRCNGASSNINDYIGNSISLRAQQNSNNFFLGRVENIQNITNSTFDVVVSGDLRDKFSQNDMDFNIKFPFFNLGKLTDFIGSDFSGSVSSSKASSQNEQNGLWYSNTFGANFSRIDSLRIGGIDDKSGCIDVNLNENGSISAIVKDSNLTRIMNNDQFLPSSNINKAMALNTGDVMLLTTNGVSIMSGDDVITFKNFLFDDFRHSLDIGEDNFYLFDSSNKSFIMNGIPEIFFGNESLVEGKLNFNKINNVFKDALNIIWIATESSGIYTIVNNNIYNFTKKNSKLKSNSIEDITQDSRGNIWVACSGGGVATGHYGNDVNNVSAINWTVFDTGIGFTSNFGLTGNINTIKERIKLDVIADGTSDPIKTSLTWINNSSIFTETIIFRSLENIPPTLTNENIIAFSPIRDSVLSVIAVNVNSQDLWRITAKAAIDYGTNTLIGKYIATDTNNNDNFYQIVSNSLNYFDVLKTDSIQPTAGKLLITSKIDDSIIIYSGNGLDINFNLIDFDIRNDKNYYYYMFFYNSINLIYKLSDGAQAIVSSDKINSDINIDIICGGDKGIFRFTPNGTQTFELITSFGENNIVTDIFFDSSNIGWISAGDKLVEFSSPNTTTEFTVNDMFGEKSSGINSLIVNNVTERLDGQIVIATNSGISIKDSLGFRSFVKNDPDITYRSENGAIKFDSWKVSKVLDNNIKNNNFISVNSNSESYLISDRNIYYSDDYGSSWVLTNSSKYKSIKDNVKFSSKIIKGGNIIDYTLVGDRAFYSSGTDSLERVSIENLPTNSNIVQSYSAGDMWLSEGISNDRMIIGLYNNNIVEDEKELAIMDFVSIGEFSDPITFISGSDGLSIQSTYCFDELIDGVDKFIFAGCKDCIVFKKNSEAWDIFKIGETEVDDFVYSSIVTRKDVESLEFEKTLYAKRSSIYGENTPIEILSIKIDSILDNKVIKYNLDGSLAGFVRPNGANLYRNQISKVDRNGFDAYCPQTVQRRIYNGHFGGLTFLNSNRTLAIGGFANTLMIVPFTSENSTDLFKNPTGVISGLRGHYRGNIIQAAYPDYYNGFDFPYEINEDETNEFSSIASFSSGLSNRTEANFLTKNKNAWSIRFNGDEGYASYLFYGQNSKNFNRKFDFNEEKNVSYLMKTRDGGQFWAPISFDNSIYPKASISDYIFDGSSTITISTINGIYDETGYNSGIFRSIDSGVNWINVSDSLPKVPVKKISLIDSNVYAGPLGFGVYSTNYNDLIALSENWISFDSRFPTQFGINIGLWKVTSIEIDKNNKDRIVIGTEDQGILESLNAGASWNFDKNGIPSGYITKVKTLETNPFIVLAGVKDDGLYIKNGETSKYEKKTVGLPDNYNVIDILIDSSFTDVFNAANINNLSNDNILVIRSELNLPSSAPINGTLYNLGDDVEDSKVVYVGTEDFTTHPLYDRIGTLRSGIPYYYKIYSVDLNLIYSEKYIIDGISSSVEPLKIVDNSNTRALSPFLTSGTGLKGRIVTPSSVTTTARFFEIDSNTADTLFLKKDPYSTINNGDATRGGGIVGRQFYRIYSTFVVISKKVNPIYIVAEDINTLISKVYYSGDNGETWSERTSGITSYNINSITQEKINVDSRLFLQETIMYAATNNGVFLTVDNGVSWNEISASSGTAILPNTNEYNKVLVDGEDPTVLYSVEKTGKIYRTIDSGTTWELMLDLENSINASDLVSFFTNYLFIGTNGFGIINVRDSIRDRVDMQVISNGNISSFDIDFFELGDSVDTDTNSITASTLVKNDSTSQNKEQVRFKTKDNVKNIEFSIKKNGNLFDIKDIFIGDQEEHPETNPFILEVPAISDDPSVINKIKSLSDNLLYVCSNLGIYESSNFGNKWNKIINSALPDVIYDVSLIRNNELALATKSGVWCSDEERTVFGIKESSGKAVKTIFESTQDGIRNFIRGGENGLRISIDNSKSIIVYSGDISNDVSLRFSWGDIFNSTDGNWSENTEIAIKEKILATANPSSVNLTSFDGWDYALIVRKGPFTTFDKALRAGENNDIFSPEFQVVYPDTISVNYSLGDSAVFSTKSSDNTSKAGLEEIRDANLSGNNSKGISFNPKRFMSDGSIIIGLLPNRKRFVADFPLSFDQGPTTDAPIIDKIQPITDQTSRNSFGLVDNFADSEAYSNGEAKSPEIKSNMFYLYRVYPYVLVPESLATTSNEDSYPALPIYRPNIGDLPDSYSYNIEINKFRGATTVFCGIIIGENNWIIGTDAGVFYSTQAGRDVNLPDSENIIGVNSKVSALIKTTDGSILAAVISNNTIYLAKSTEIPLGKNWEILTSTIADFESSNIKRIYNISEDSNGFLYISTNIGIFKANSDGSSLVFSGSVGDLEALTNGSIIGQEIYIS